MLDEVESSLAHAQANLAKAAAALSLAVGNRQHDMWTGDRYNVAPEQLDRAHALQSVSPEHWTARDLDFVMFKCMTTMGGELTFRFILPRYLSAVAADPFDGWVSQSHVLLGKLQRLQVHSWRGEEAGALAAALIAFAELELAMESDFSAEDEWVEPQTDDAVALRTAAARLTLQHPASLVSPTPRGKLGRD